jgi:hypothetical protein
MMRDDAQDKSARWLIAVMTLVLIMMMAGGAVASLVELHGG